MAADGGIDKPVGLRQRKVNVTNRKSDQEVVIGLLSEIQASDGGQEEAWRTSPPVASKDGTIDKRLADAIFDFQVFWKDQGVFRFPDGVCDPDGNTIKKMLAIVRGLSFTPDPTLRFPPEGQMDSTACWAACYAWWLRATPGEGVLSQRRQVDIVGDGASANIWDKRSGQVLVDEYMRFLSGRHLNLTAAMVPTDKVKDALVRGNPRIRPIIVGFRIGPVDGHVNVIHGIDPDKDMVSAMECWDPNPEADRTVTKEIIDNQPIYTTRGGDAFKFRGAHIKRPLQYYTNHALRNGSLLMFPFTS